MRIYAGDPMPPECGQDRSLDEAALARIIHDPLRLVDCLPPFSAEANC